MIIFFFQIKVARKILKHLLTGNPNVDQESSSMNFLQSVSTCLQQINDISRAIESVLQSLELNRGIVSHAAEAGWNLDVMAETSPEDYMTRFASSIGTSIVAQSLKQLTNTRYNNNKHIWANLEPYCNSIFQI